MGDYWVVLGCYVLTLGVLWTLSLYKADTLWQDCQSRYDLLNRKRDLELLQGFQPIHPHAAVEAWLAAQLAAQLREWQTPQVAADRLQQRRAAFPWVLIRDDQGRRRRVAHFSNEGEASLRAAELRNLMPRSHFFVRYDPTGTKTAKQWSQAQTGRRVDQPLHRPNKPSPKRRQRHVEHTKPDQARRH